MADCIYWCERDKAHGTRALTPYQALDSEGWKTASEILFREVLAVFTLSPFMTLFTATVDLIFFTIWISLYIMAYFSVRALSGMLRRSLIERRCAILQGELNSPPQGRHIRPRASPYERELKHASDIDTHTFGVPFNKVRDEPPKKSWEL